MTGVRLTLLCVALLVACTTAPVDERFVAAPPDRTSFPNVADVLVCRCGTLDCHGTLARNLRLFGQTGLRKESADAGATLQPQANSNPTTQAEYDEDYQSVISLEPEILSQVVSEHGKNPERLTLVRKARGTEHHKGNTIWAAGSPGDNCLTSWIGGSPDTNACSAAQAAQGVVLACRQSPPQ
jgi:hypothetical protein